MLERRAGGRDGRRRLRSHISDHLFLSGHGRLIPQPPESHRHFLAQLTSRLDIAGLGGRLGLGRNGIYRSGIERRPAAKHAVERRKA